MFKMFKITAVKDMYLETEIPEEAKFIATDQGGTVSIFSTRPSIVGDEFIEFIDEYHTCLESIGTTAYIGDWKDSLRRCTDRLSVVMMLLDYTSALSFEPAEPAEPAEDKMFKITEVINTQLSCTFNGDVFIATDQGGNVFLYDNRPVLDGDGFSWAGGSTNQFVGCIKYSGDWKGSLRKLNLGGYWHSAKDILITYIVLSKEKPAEKPAEESNSPLEERIAEELQPLNTKPSEYEALVADQWVRITDLRTVQEVDWSTVALDTPCLVGTFNKPAHFCKYKDGKVYVWAKGKTSHTTEACHTVSAVRLAL